ncbi:MAG: 50S ribosomal protein L4 [Patescibacteria group bacterium]|jgi:large subunit ribosomal protein L4
MANIKVYNIDGQNIGEEKMDAKVFEIKPKAVVIQQAVVAQQANSRVAIAHTKTKGEVRGGGKKPWKQKGTGQARVGSIRSPLWKGGGVIFGPRSNRNFSLKINKKTKNKALKMVLSDKLANEKIILLDKLELKEAKTKNLKNLLKKLPCGEKKVMFSMAEKQENILRAGKNLYHIAFCAANSLNVVDLLKYDFLILDKEALKKIIAVYGK